MKKKTKTILTEKRKYKGIKGMSQSASNKKRRGHILMRH